MRTVGIDVAAQPSATASCSVVWAPTSARIEEVATDLDDDRLLEILATNQATRIGVDVPLGWPTAFVAALTRHHASEPWGDLEDPPKGKTLTHRATDRWIHSEPD